MSIILRSSSAGVITSVIIKFILESRIKYVYCQDEIVTGRDTKRVCVENRNQ